MALSLPNYACELRAVETLTPDVIAEMQALYLACYDGSSAAVFEADLRQKDEVLILRHAGRLVGFTTLLSFVHDQGKEAMHVVFSGDTVVEPAHWGQTALSYAWVRHMGRVKQRRPALRLWWLLLVKGHRTYRYLEVFARDYHPRPGHEDAELKALTDVLAQGLYPRDYRPQSGVVEFAASRGHLRPEWAEPRSDELRRPSVAYFLARNPGFRQGHELVCLCEMEAHNMKPLTRRLFRAGCEGVSGADPDA